MKKQLRFGDLLRNEKFNKIRFSRKGEVVAINDNEKIAMQISDFMKKQMCIEERMIGSVTTEMKEHYINTLKRIGDIYNNPNVNSHLKKACLLDIKDEIIIKPL